jgi:hypothetical protein
LVLDIDIDIGIGILAVYVDIAPSQPLPGYTATLAGILGDRRSVV